MREMIEFRILEEDASQWLRPDEGEVLDGFVRKYKLKKNDPRFHVIGEIDRTFRRRGRFFFTAWIQSRKYTKIEIEKAELFHLRVASVFEPTGEECGTKYDDIEACPECEAGAQQVGPLFLDWRKIPKGKDICRTIGGELVVSRRFFETFNSHGVSGVEFRPILRNPTSNARSDNWLQLVVTSSNAEITPPTRVGETPFDEEQLTRCSRGDLLGLSLLSEVSIKRTSREMADVVSSKQWIGTRRGLLRPERVVLISPKARRSIETQKLKGCTIEVAYLV